MNFKNILPLVLVLIVHFGQAQSIRDLLEIAAKNNPGIQAKYKEFEAALQQVEQVDALPDPNFSFGYFVSPVETRVGPQRARFSLTQMFPWFGTLDARQDAASLTAEARYAAFLEARNLLYYKVAVAYYPLYELERWKRIETENIQILESYKSIATKKFEHGNGTLVDVLRVDLQLKEARTNLGILEDKERPLVTRLNKLLNREETVPVGLDSLYVAEVLPADYRRDSLLIGNPGLQKLDAQIEASAAQEKVAQMQGYPQFGVGLDYVLVGRRTDLSGGVEAPEGNGRNALMPMVSMSIPIFSGKYRASAKEARLMQESYTLQKEEYENMLIADYETARFEINRQRDLLDLYEQQIRESRQALNLLLSAYGNSGSDFEEVLRMQQQLLKYEKMKASAKMQFHIAVAKLHYLTAKTY
jgi:outer membrane protein TolC